MIGGDTQLICELKRQFSDCLVNYKKHDFSNGNFIYSFEDPHLNTVTIIADLTYHTHKNLVGLFFCLDYFKQNGITVAKLIFPYFPYSRSNSGHKNQSNNLNTIIDTLDNYRVNKIITFDPHFGDQQFDNNIDFVYIDHYSIFSTLFGNINKGNSVIIGPDQGSRGRINKYSLLTNIEGICLKKKRSNHNEEVEITMDSTIANTINNHDTYIILDDEICSGYTIQKVINVLVEINDNCNIYICVTHSFIRENPLFLIKKNIMGFYTTNSLDWIININSEKLSVVNLAQHIGSIITDA